MKKKLKFAAYQYGKVYKDSDADKCVYIEIHARSLSLRKTTEVQAAFPPNAFPVENIAQNPGQKKDKSAPSRGGYAGDVLYLLFISADAGKALAVPSRNTAVSRAIRRERGCLPVRTMPLWRSVRGRKRTSGKPRADLP